MILLELFSGIGGFAKGFEQAGYKFTKHYFSEIDKHAIANYKYNFKNAESIGSVTDVSGSSIEKTIQRNPAESNHINKTEFTTVQDYFVH